MKILLIHPPLENLLTVGIPSLVEKRGFNPSMGILYVAAYSAQNTDHIVDVLDAPLEGVGYDKLEQIIREREPDIVGISTLTFSLIDSVKTARIVKKVSKSIPVVFGGIHVSLFPIETISLEEVDYAVVGEGEITFAELIENIGNTERLKTVKGLLFKENGRIIDTGPRPLIEDLDRLPFPARRLTSFQNFYSLNKKTLATTMITSRGCPYNCLFCIRPRFGRKFRSRSPQNVVSELKECLSMGIGEFFIYDDIFTISRQRVLDICDKIIDEGLEVEWSVMTRVDRIDREMIKKMKRAGCTRIRYGIESGTTEILKVLRKGITLEQVREAFRITKAEGISTVAYFMIGAPTETKQQIMETIRMARELNAAYTNFSIVTLYPGTDLYSLGLKRGILERDCWRHFSKNPRPNFQLPLWEEKFTRHELIKIQSSAYSSVYFRPSYIARKLSKISTWKGLREIIRLGFKLIRSWIASHNLL